MNVVNEQVRHSKFGAGTVVNQTENVVKWNSVRNTD